MLGFKTPPLFVIRKSSVFLYESCTDKIDIAKFFETLKLDDTFNSWFCITRWHVWYDYLLFFFFNLNVIFFVNNVTG